MDTPDEVTTLLAKADEARIVAERMHDAECKRTMLTIACGYDAMAVHLAHFLDALQSHEQP